MRQLMREFHDPAADLLDYDAFHSSEGTTPASTPPRQGRPVRNIRRPRAFHSPAEFSHSSTSSASRDDYERDPTYQLPAYYQRQRAAAQPPPRPSHKRHRAATDGGSHKRRRLE
jgi:hypothetical protein